MVDAMGEQFLKAGEDNDIYDWVTGIYGDPWGTYSIGAILSDPGR